MWNWLDRLAYAAQPAARQHLIGRHDDRLAGSERQAAQRLMRSRSMSAVSEAKF